MAAPLKTQPRDPAAEFELRLDDELLAEVDADSGSLKLFIAKMLMGYSLTNPEELTVLPQVSVNLESNTYRLGHMRKSFEGNDDCVRRHISLCRIIPRS